MPPEFEPSHDTLPPATCNLQLATAALPCDAYHHYYHYQSSTQYLWLARVSFALGNRDEAMIALDKALFQDHFNEEALLMKARERAEAVEYTYNKHPLYDAEFCDSIGKQPDATTQLHDAAVRSWLEHDINSALIQFSAAIARSPTHSNNHLGLGKCFFVLEKNVQAREHLHKAISLSHSEHDAYHRTASALHVKRAREFLLNGGYDLAINDFTKALDLHRGNTEALQERADAQKMKNKNQDAQSVIL